MAMPNIGEEVLDIKYDNPYDSQRLSIIESLIPHAPANGRVALDLGCGSGYVSRLLADRGWAVTAVDIDAGNIERTSARVTKAIHGDALSVCRSLSSSSFNLVCGFELIEHVSRDDGVALLAECARICRNTASLLLSTPNRMSPEGLYGYYYGELLRGTRWNAWDTTHQYIYSSVELLRILRELGWRVDAIVGYYYDGRISLPLKSSRRFPLNRFGFNTLVRAQLRSD
jgi:2-polyprenyl-3-methyl-5-hydroxy-6-metoxy-1,4-benzoquinol methylase